MQCVFPQLPRNRDEPDSRTFQVGEEVCLRGDYAGRTRGRYTRAQPREGTDLVFIHVIDDRWFGWEKVGKLVPATVSPTAVKVVGRNLQVNTSGTGTVGFPEDLERKIMGYGRKTRRQRRKRRHPRSSVRKSIRS